MRSPNTPLDYATGGTSRSFGSSGGAGGLFSGEMSAAPPLGMDRNRLEHKRSYDGLNAFDRAMAAHHSNHSQRPNRDNSTAPASESSGSNHHGWLSTANSPVPLGPHNEGVVDDVQEQRENEREREQNDPPLENRVHGHAPPLYTNSSSPQQELPAQLEDEEHDEESSDDDDDRFWNTSAIPTRGMPPLIPVPTPTATPKWTRMELLGKGTFTKLYTARYATGEVLAVKQAEMPQTISGQDDIREVSILNSLKAERDALEQLDHPNIVQYLGFEQTSEFFSV